MLRLARLSTLANTILLTGLLACGHDKTDAAKSDATFRVALLTPGPISDQSWNAGAYRGLEQILKEWSELREVIGLAKVPDHSTIQKAAERLLKKGGPTPSCGRPCAAPGHAA